MKTYTIIPLFRSRTPYGVKLAMPGKTILVASFAELWQAVSYIDRQER